ncbi:UNVERIFIED_ORG: hypothetical protein J2Y78_003807 [Buttiauxella agrestis ATCC 33320]
MEAHTSFDWLDFTSKAAGPVLAAILAAILATWFSSNRFYKEKWWEKRLQSFTDLIEIAYRVKMVDDYSLECQYLNKGEGSHGFNQHPKDVADALYAEYWRDIQDIERISQLAEFTLTPKAAKILNDFLAKRKQIRSDFHEEAMSSEDCEEEDYKASKKLLEELVAEAKGNLKIRH